MMPTPIELLLFHRSLELDQACMRGGASAIIIDLENKGKDIRQSGFDTEINSHSIADIEKLKQLAGIRVICRINGFNTDTHNEIERVIAAGADEILLPMVTMQADVERCLSLISGRCLLGIMLETREVLAFSSRLEAYPLARVYVGLNDLRISRGSPSIFDAISNGTIDTLRQQFPNIPFGFAGLTIPGHGHPVPVHLLTAELARLDCDFTFLRRSFFKDTAGRDVALEILRIQAAMQKARLRSLADIETDQRALQTVLAKAAPTP